MVLPLRNLTVGSRFKQALCCFHFQSLHKFKSANHETLHFHLEKCTSMNQIKQIHAQIILQGPTNQILTLGKLISFCAVSNNGNLEYARLVFDRITEPNKFMYNSLIRGYSTGDNPIKAILLYREMTYMGLGPNEFTLPFVLKACASVSAYWVAVAVHGHSFKQGIGSQVYVQNALIYVYVACGLILCARKVFDEIPQRTLVSWNSMIGGYSKMSCCKEAFLLFKEMRDLGLELDEISLVNLLSVCSQSCDLDLGRYLHLYMVVTGVEIDVIVRNALLDMYAKCGDLHSAQTVFERMSYKNVVSWTSMVTAFAKHQLVNSARDVFDRMPEKNVVSWNSMISCYIREGHCKDALNLFHEMSDLGVEADETTLVCVLSACSQIGDLVMGKKVHNYIYNNDTIPSVTLCNALIDMYAKCGFAGRALDIFSEMPEKNLVSWNVIIGAVALHGYGLKGVNLFEEMLGGRIWRPDEITFMGLLSACSHSGLVDIGKYYFDRMKSVYGVSPEIQHYACMVDLLGRGGFLEEAVRLIGRMPMKPDVVIWGALLGACRTHCNVEIGKLILKQLLELEPNSSGLYVLIANLFSESQRWEDVKNIRKLMNDCGIMKCKAISFIEIEGCVHEFMVDDKRHEESSNIFSMLDQLTDDLKSIGYACNYFGASLDSEER
ncbi:pentatricopeptide repeat-containing protein At2g22410, mitochondrial-like [Mangifera indica]|uniref:pentatricopeptide repeat-containing protein At2g22410, mitochondrial-like n=1 Tax=Mangifera indica TaxID=29780 RepID=UPI001CFA44FB|nr:pentatricopeptide repeat-containing protein At2g22410, mitochondrial-like [Mangifera indica]